MLKGNFIKELGAFKMDVSLTVGNRELLVILGASGCGKSTLLNSMAGFIESDQGSFELDKIQYDDGASGHHLAINKRQIAYIQQGNTLFPHLSVKENILYSLPKNKWQAAKAHYTELLKLLNIADLEHRKPHTLSGGQQQRVAIGRSLMMSPKLILWDEPFSALDHMIREDLRHLVLSLKNRLGIPMIFVTHDLEEAFQLADRLAIMSEGQILQLDDRDKVFNNPVNSLVGKILGITNTLKATYTQATSIKQIKGGKLVTFKCEGIELKGVDIEARLQDLPKGTQVQIGIRPEQILYVREEASSEIPLATEVEGNIFEATVLSVVKHLDAYRLKIVLDGLRSPLMMDIPRGVIQRYDIHEGKRIKVLLKYKRLIIMEADTSESIQKNKDVVEVDDNSIKAKQSPLEVALERYRQMEKTVSACPVIGISGVSNSGKTTVMIKLIEALSDKGYKIGTIKHDGHGFEMDHEGKDTYKHRQAGAEAVAIASKDQYSIIRQTKDAEIELEDIIKDYKDMDLILVEGYKFSALPKFEVIRQERSDQGVCRSETLLARVTDVLVESDGIPNIALSETEQVVEIIEEIIMEASNER